MDYRFYGFSVKKALIALLTAAALAISLPAFAQNIPRPRYLTGHSHSCSYTNPEYMLGDDGMAVHAYPGSRVFSAAFTGWRGKRWADAYWITGWHDENSSICNKRTVAGTVNAKGTSLVPGRLGGKLVTADLTEYGSGAQYALRLGFDLWLTAVPLATPTKMMHDPRTWEILLQPGTRNYVNRQFVGWHRIFMGVTGNWDHTVFSVHGLDLTRIAENLGVPRGYWWNTIGAGGEAGGGWFTVTSYSLHIAGEHPVLHHPKPKHKHRKIIRKHPKHKPKHGRIVRRHPKHKPPKPRPKPPVCPSLCIPHERIWH